MYQDFIRIFHICRIYRRLSVSLHPHTTLCRPYHISEINLDLTVETVADDNAVCDVASLISEDTVVSDIVADDDTSTCMSKQEEVYDDVCDSSKSVMSDDEAGIPGGIE